MSINFLSNSVSVLIYAIGSTLFAYQINEIMQKNDEPNTTLKNFIKVTNVIIQKIKEQNMPKEDVEKVLNLINEVKDLCSIEQTNSHIEEEG